ncbi:MAG TPA: hypothetical protein VF778_14500 [Xanthobacteraceae bacterium]
MSRRNPWAILYASLVFGVILAPYCSLGLLLGLSLFFHFPTPHFGIPGLVLLGVLTVLLLGVFIARTQVEQRLRQRLGRLLPPLLALLVMLAAGDLVLVTLETADPFPFAPPSERWANFIEITAIGAVVAAIAVIVRPASRLERSITIRLDRANPWHRAYRAAGYVVLTGALLFASYWIYQNYLYERYCSDARQQDYIDCQFL